MKQIYRLTAFAVVFFLSIQGYSQQDQYKLLLKSGEVITDANLNSFDQNISAQDALDGYLFRILQFYTIPKLSDKKILTDKGIILMDYLPEKAFVAAIPVATEKKVLHDAGVRSIIEFSPEMKMSSNLFQIPEHAIRNENKVELDVKIHSNIALTSASELLSAAGYHVISFRDFGHVVTVVAEMNKLTDLASLPYVYYIDVVAPPPTPDDTRARSLHRVNRIQNEYLGGRNYTGAGVTVAIADDGAVGPHIDFTGRITQHLTNAGGTHGDMTAGIMVGAGNLNPVYKGSAPGAHINMYTITGYNHIVDAVSNYNNLSTVITSTSYSQGSGGVYTADAQAIDNQIKNNPQLIHVFSAGNAGSGWSTITGGYKAGKSVIACGNLNGYDVLESSSSRGPAEDGRIKPDICANGANQMSTDPNNTYAAGGGTSAASPSIAAVVTCLYEAYKTLNNVANPPSALIKAVMLNSAEDLGNPGPDYSHGWGRVNAFRALTTLEEGRYLSALVDQGDSNIHSITVPPGISQVRVMVYWADEGGSPGASKALVNDLNIYLTEPGGLSYDPWVLNPATPNALAVRAIDDLNPVEQVTLDNPAAGMYTVTVKGFSVPQGPQEYFLVYEFRTDEIIISYPAGGEGFVPGEQEHIRWEAFGNSGNFAVQYSADNGTTWNNINMNVTASARHLTWTVPNNITSEAKIKVTRGSISGESQNNFSIVGLPTNINFISVCPDSVELSWNAVNGAVGYEISRLGVMYMDSIAYSTTTSAIVAGHNLMNDAWYSVRAIMANGNKGRRANAVYKSPGLLNCVLAYDASLIILNPTGGVLFDCQNISTQQISVELTNQGANPISNFPLYYSINGGIAISETYTGTIAPGATVNYLFSNTLNLTTPDTFNLNIWVEYPGDNNLYNDSAKSTVIVINGLIVSLPWTENFESFGLCSTSSNCEAVTCNLGNGFLNQPNIEIDQIDWRTNSGSTPSSGTGPSNDHTLGNSTGKYLYLEASTCFQRQGLLTTPCIDLTTATSPQLTFWYHMNGAAMGSLHVDVLNNGMWVLNAMPPISGSQGNSWQQATLNLASYSGNIITIRFRGNTGSDYTSDIAIDDINVLELNAPPVALFSASSTNASVGQTIQLTDLTSNSPSQWQWNISPSTFTFVNGTSNSSQNPEIQFSVLGTYTISLTVNNSFGNDSVSSMVNIITGAPLPFVENFEGMNYPPANWNVINPGGNYTWQQSNVITGADGNPSFASYINNFAYNNVGAQDALQTPLLDIPSGSAVALFTFDVAYARYSNTFSDTLRIDVSTDCGENFIPTGYIKGGTTLSTVPDQTTIFTPTNANQWRRDTIILSSFAGNNLMFRFVNINGFGNSLFIDNINIDFAVSVNEILAASDVTIYPNPANEIVHVKMLNIKGHILIEIYDVKGRMTMKEEYVNASSYSERTINVSALDKGIYLLKLSTEQGIHVKKLIIN